MEQLFFDKNSRSFGLNIRKAKLYVKKKNDRRKMTARYEERIWVGVADNDYQV